MLEDEERLELGITTDWDVGENVVCVGCTIFCGTISLEDDVGGMDDKLRAGVDMESELDKEEEEEVGMVVLVIVGMGVVVSDMRTCLVV